MSSELTTTPTLGDDAKCPISEFPTHIDAEGLEEQPVHDQLPSVEEVKVDHANGAANPNPTPTFGDDTMCPLSVFPTQIDAEDLEEPVHDQLPSVEEVKVDLGNGAANPNPTPTFGDDAMCPISDFPTQIDAEDLEEQPVHDQLPSVEEVKVDLGNGAAKTFIFRRKCLRCTLLLAVAALVALAVSTIVLGVKHEQKNHNTGGANEIEIESEGVRDSAKRIEEVMQFLLEHDATEETSLRFPGSPQNLAANFLASGDWYTYCWELTPENAQLFVERFALATFFYHFKGPQWTYQLSFVSNFDTCYWFARFSTAGGDNIREGVTCDDEGFVTKLIVTLNNLEATSFPPELRNLVFLETLHLSNNPLITGELPAVFREMPSLKSVAIQECNLFGTLPDWIGDHTSLTSLSLGNNQFEGQLPESFKKLTNLRFLGLSSNNQLKGNINDLLSSMYQLEYLYLEDNFFDGELDGLIDRWPKLLELDVSNNILDGKVPTVLMNHATLMVADLHRNVFGKQFPDDIFINTKLEFLALHNNIITGTIPDRMAFLSNLKHLDLSTNKLTGTIPDTVGAMKDLRYLAMSTNPFQDQPLVDFSKLTNLRELTMKNSSLTGTIPDWVGELTNIQLLDLDANKLTGTIPSWIGLLTSLDHLLLNRNELTGTLPTTLSNMRDLTVFLIDGNSITGNADVICQSPNVNPQVFISDCYPSPDGTGPEVQCLCCDLCCEDGLPCSPDL